MPSRSSYAKLPKAVVNKAEVILRSVTFGGAPVSEVGSPQGKTMMRSERSADSAFRTLLALGGIAVSVLLIAIFFSLLISSRPALVANGFRFLTGSEWDPVTNTFQALPFVFGTLLTSLIALVIATVLSLALAILMGEYFRTGPSPPSCARRWSCWRGFPRSSTDSSGCSSSSPPCGCCRSRWARRPSAWASSPPRSSWRS